MPTQVQETDYLVIGGGAMSAAFVDALIAGDKKSKITIIERRDRLTGHWNNAYPFVTLHQPAIWYGVNSLELSKRDVSDLSTLPEIHEYYDEVLHKFKASGQVTFLGEHNYLGDKKAAPIDRPDDVIEFKVNKRVVNGTYMAVEVPSTHPPKFDVAEGVPFVPPNNLPEEAGKWDHYYVLGCGKTGMDAVLYLLKSGIPQEKIKWVMSNDVWCFERSDLQPRKAMKMVLKHCNAIVKSKNADEVFLRLEDNGGVMRLDKTALPKKWKCPTVSREEIDAIKPLEHKIRLGRVSKIDEAGIHFANETMAYPENALFVNCTADALAPRDPKPVFSKGHIELQSIFFCQQVFSSAAIGRLEQAPLTDGMRNWVKSVPHPKTPEDWPSVLSRTIDNALKLHAFMPLWMIRSRLFYLSHEPIWDYLVYATKAFLVSSPLRRAARRLDALR